MNIIGTTIQQGVIQNYMTVDVLTVAQLLELMKDKNFINITSPDKNILQIIVKIDPTEVVEVPLEQRAFHLVPTKTYMLRITDGTGTDALSEIISQRPELVMELDAYLKLIANIPMFMPPINEFQLANIQDSELPAYIPLISPYGSNVDFKYLKITDRVKAIADLKAYNENNSRRYENRSAFDIIELLAVKMGIAKRETDYYTALDLDTHEILITKPHDYIDLEADPTISDIMKEDNSLWYENAFFIINKETKETNAAQTVQEFYDVVSSTLYHSSFTAQLLTHGEVEVPVVNDGTEDLVPAPIAETEVTPLVPKSE